MRDSFIYTVGQPDLKSGSIEAIHSRGYRAGLLLDSKLSNKYADKFDTVIEFDFDNIDTEIKRLSEIDPNPGGFVCTYENYVTSKAKLGQFFGLHAPSVQSAEICTDKSLMRQAFIDYDPEISPNFTIIDSVESALNFAKRFGYPLIIKPTGLVKSLLVFRCDNENELRENVEYSLRSVNELYQKYRIYGRDAKLIVEEFMSGKQYSIAAFVDYQGTPHFCEGATALTTAKDIGVMDNYLYKRELPAKINESLMGELLRVSESGVRALKMTSTPAHIELMHTEKGVKIVEIGARIGGYRPRMYEHCYNLDLPAQEIKLAIGEQPGVNGSFSKYCATYELFPENEGEFSEVTGLANPENLTYYRETAKKGSRIGPAKNGYKATVIAMIVDSERDAFEKKCNEFEIAKVKIDHENSPPTTS